MNIHVPEVVEQIELASQRHGRGFVWSEERIETLKQLWADGWSASRIASELGGVTRNAVVGKVHRLGLSGRVERKAARSTVRRKSMRAAPVDFRRFTNGATAPYEPEPIAVDDADIPIEQQRALLELQPGMCRYPISGEGLQTMFCGGRQIPESSYCHTHDRRCHQ